MSAPVRETETMLGQPPSGPSSRRAWKRPKWMQAQEAGVAAALVAMFAVFTILEPGKFATVDNIKFLASDTSILAILAMATTFVIVSANLDLSIGSIVAFSEVVAVKGMDAVGGSGLWTCLFGLLVAVVAGAAWGLVNGLLISKAKIPSFVVTLATLGMALGAALLITGGTDLADVPPDLVSTLGTGQIAGIPALVLIAAIAVIATAFVLRRTRFGRYTYATGSDPVAAERAGINVAKHLTRIYVYAGAAYGVAAFLGLSRFGTTSIGGHNNDALNAVAAVALGGASLFGGVGTALGSLIGVSIPAVLANGLVIGHVQPYWQQIAIGAALLLAVYADQLRRRAQRRS